MKSDDALIYSLGDSGIICIQPALSTKKKMEIVFSIFGGRPIG